MIDLHMHSDYSDGKLSVEELFEDVKRRGITTFSLTDHDNCEGAVRMEELSKASGIQFIKGVEFSCLMDIDVPESDCHILGYDFDLNDEEINELQKRSLDLRKEKLEELLNFIETEYGFVLKDDAKARLRANRKVGKPNVADEMIKAGFCTKENVWNNYLENFNSKKHPGAEETIKIIKNAGGIAIWAHPLGDNQEPENRDTVKQFSPKFEKMMSFGIDGIECCYSKYLEKEIQFLIKIANENNLYITGGSDYHGKKDGIIKVGDTGREKNHSEDLVKFANYLGGR